MNCKSLKMHDDQKITLSQNLSTLLEIHQVSLSQIAQTLDIPVMTIRRLLSGETTDPRISTLKLIADYFNVTVDSLIQSNEKFIKHSRKKSIPLFLPILDWETAQKITTIHELDLTKWKSWQSISLNEKDSISNDAFALESRPSMYPRFPQGTLFIIDPNISPIDGDTVLVKLTPNNELTLRELSIDPPEWILHPLIPSSKQLQFSKKDHLIVGVNLMTVLYNSRMK